jgi:hypothetical protein
VAIVDVLKLTYATLEQVGRLYVPTRTPLISFEQMNHMSAEAGVTTNEAEGGPMWGRFFDSIGGGDDTESALSGSHMPTDLHNSSFSLSQVQQSPQSEVHPNDSASVVDDSSVLEGLPRKGINIPSISGAAPSAVADDGTYVFKFRTPSGNTHRFQSRHDNVEHLRDIVAGKLAQDSFFLEFNPKGADDTIPDPLDFRLTYTDSDGDTVLITSDDDVTDAVKNARNAGVDRVVLTIQGGRGWADTAEKSETKAAASAAAALQEVKEVEKVERTETPTPLPEYAAMAPPAPVHVIAAPDDIFGIPRDMVLPASIGALAVVIIAVFTVSRLTQD